MSKIALLKGGLNSENKVSLKTAEACSFALKELEYELVEIDIKDQFISTGFIPISLIRWEMTGLNDEIKLLNQ